MKVLLLYATPRSGHAQASHALKQAFEEAGGFEVEEYFVQKKSRFYSSVLSSSYRWLVWRTPKIWGYFHGNPLYRPLMTWVFRAMYWIDLGGFRTKARQAKPDIVIALHVLPLHILSEAKRHGELSARLCVLTTDLWAHPYWFNPQVEKYFASTNHAKADLIQAGAERQRITVTGIPVRQMFRSLPTRSAAREELKLDPQKTTIMVMGGSYGLFPFVELLTRVLKSEDLRRQQWLFLCGSDEDVYRDALAVLAEQPNPDIHIFSFRQDIATFMVASDLTITKPGGITSSEALTCGLPMLIYRPLPGQERVNADILRKAGAAQVAHSLRQLIRDLRVTLEQPAQLLEMKNNCLKLARPHAGADIARLCKETVDA